MRRCSRALLPATLVALAASGCVPVYAPPARGVQYGAPGRVRAGDLEIGGTMIGVYAPNGGSAHIAYGLSDRVAIEAGGTVAVAPAGPESGSFVMGMGWVGGRFTRPRRSWGVSLLLDGELGIGAGAGGESCASNASNQTVCGHDGLRPWTRPAFGGYQGGAVGLAYRWFSLYGRARVEESGGENVPVTLWPSAMLGLGFDVTQRFSLDVGGGYVGYFNRRDQENGWFYQTGLTLRFGRDR